MPSPLWGIYLHGWFIRWAKAGVFDRIMREAGRCVDARGGFKLYQCFVDATFSTAREGGDSLGTTKGGKGVKIILLVDANGLPVAGQVEARVYQLRLVSRQLALHLKQERIVRAGIDHH